MARTIRTRSRTRLTLSGKKKVIRTGPGTDYPLTLSYSETVDDYVGSPITDSSFVKSGVGSKSEAGDILRIDGTGQTYWFGYETIVCTTYPATVGTTLNTAPIRPPNGWMLDLVAGTNPSRPIVTPPTLLQDLVELPKMVYNLGKLLQRPSGVATPAGVSSQYLGIKFGWAPLVEDINHLLNLQKYAIKRAKEIHQLQSGKGLRRRLQFGSDTLNEARSAPLHTAGTNYCSFNYDVVVKKKSWATIRWYPALLPPYHPSDEENHRVALRVVAGLTPEGLAKGAWDVIPWTWLLGWFTNVGKYALAYSNTVPATHGSGCFMCRSDTSYTPKGITYTGNWYKRELAMSGGFSSHRLERYIGTEVTPGANFPFLDNSRLSVLGALFAQRFMR